MWRDSAEPTPLKSHRSSSAWGPILEGVMLFVSRDEWQLSFVVVGELRRNGDGRVSSM